MSDLFLKNFQIKAVERLEQAFYNGSSEVILKSCTGSGKTIILSHFIDEFCKSNSGYVFMWFTPGAGNLEEQSKGKFDKYMHNSKSKLMSDVLVSGFEENDVCFINWELVTKAGNNAMRDGERKNLSEQINIAHSMNLKFVVIVDEEHLNKTYKANDIIQLFKAVCVFRVSATPHGNGDATLVSISEEEVISEGLIKKMLVINEDIEDGVSLDDQVNYLVDKALKKRMRIHEEFCKNNISVNPLVIIQMPNKSDDLLEHVESFLEMKNINYLNGKLSIRLADRVENFENIEDVNAKQDVLIIKQAIATGWDCPRAYILVKLRDNMEERFEIQTIGRIRRMPQAKHYESSLLDRCYLYTFDEKFTEGVKLHMSGNAFNAKILYLKNGYDDIKLVKEYKSSAPIGVDPKVVRLTLYKHFVKKYNTASVANNKKILESHGYNFDSDVLIHSIQGNVRVVNKESIDHLNTLEAKVQLNTHQHGRDFHKAIGLIGASIGLPYDKAVTVIRNLFEVNSKFSNKILNLTTRELYSFILNNQKKLSEDFIDANSDYDLQLEISLDMVGTSEFTLPKEMTLFYNSQTLGSIYEKSVFQGYTSTAEPRSDSERLFERFCEKSESILWFYKNGDSGFEYFSIVYTDNIGKQRLFYPDYLVSLNGELWLIETKGGESKSGNSENIDKYSEMKFEAMSTYLNKYNLKGGFVRLNRHDMELYITTTSYEEDMSKSCWSLLETTMR